LADVLRENKDRLDFCKVYAHPFLPFAILTGGKYDEVLLSWGQNDAKLPISLLGRGMTISQCSFSPDGKWLIFRNENIKADTMKTYIMPVSEKYPNYLGSPILLFDKAFGGAVNNKRGGPQNSDSVVRWAAAH
jgi:hypothetical protein